MSVRTVDKRLELARDIEKLDRRREHDDVSSFHPADNAGGIVGLGGRSIAVVLTLAEIPDIIIIDIQHLYRVAGLFRPFFELQAQCLAIAARLNEIDRSTEY